MSCRPLIYVAQRAAQKLVLTPLATLSARCLLRLWGARVGKGLIVRGRLRLRILGTLEIGDSVRLQSGYSNYVGGHQPLGICVMPGARVVLGHRCGISNSTIVCQSEVRILEGTFIGGGSRIYDTDFHQLDAESRLANVGEVASQPVCIGPRAFIGGHCIILKGVTIGEGAVIGAGSVVTRDVPPYEVWAGVPAKRIRQLDRHA